MTSELSRLHSILNSEDLVPDVAYRRNKVLFEFVSYVNCLIGCVLSERRIMMPVFVQRCREFMDNQASAEHDRYYSVVRSYLAAVEQTFDLQKDTQTPNNNSF
jgi:hypothetical protein